MTQQSRLKGRVLSASAALIGLSLAVSAAVAPAAANRVGVAAAVNPDAFSSLAGAPQSQLNIGKSIFFNERIKTTDSGLVQVLLVDGSTFTVGPDSDLVIDKFVYDANKGTGQLAATFSKGVMRFVGGKISKRDGGVTIDTPVGVLAVRGCIIQSKFEGKNGIISFVYGRYAHLTFDNGETLKAFAAGFTIDTAIRAVRPTRPEDTAAIMAGLTSSGNNPGNPGNAMDTASNAGSTFEMVDTANLNELVQNATTQVAVDSATEVNPVVPPTVTDPDPTPTPCEGFDCGTPQGQLQGYAGGVYLSQDHVTQNDNPSHDLSQSTDDPDLNREYGTLANHSAEEVNFTFNEDGDEDNTNDSFSARFRLHVGEPESDEGGILINFGDKEPPSNSEIRRSFIIPPVVNPPSSGFFYAFNGLDNPDDLDEVDGITIFHDNDEKATLIGRPPIAFLFSSESFGQQEGPSPNVLKLSHDEEEAPPLPEFCTDCTFMKWGIFGAAAAFEDDGSETGAREVGILGFWVAGDIPAVGDLPFDGTAVYNGDAIGMVATNLYHDDAQHPGEYVGEDGWRTYTATGKMRMDWDFGRREGDLTISKFDQKHYGEDGVTFGGKMCAPGVAGCGANTPSGNHFGGALTSRGSNPNEPTNLNGFAVGSFARGPSNYDDNGNPRRGSTPDGAMGNFQVGNDSYRASGVFAGKRIGN